MGENQHKLPQKDIRRYKELICIMKSPVTDPDYCTFWTPIRRTYQDIAESGRSSFLIGKKETTNKTCINCQNSRNIKIKVK